MTDPRQFINPVAVTFTPADGSPIVYGHVSRLVYSEEPTIEAFAGDSDVFESCVTVARLKCQVVVESTAPGAMDATPSGTRGTLSWVAADSFNGGDAGGGAELYTLTNVVFSRKPIEVPYYQFARTAFAFRAASPDGRNSPLIAAPV